MATNNDINTGKPIEVAAGGTGIASATVFAPICGGTITTGPLQSAATNIATAGFILTSTGNASLPTWQTGGGGFASACNFKATTDNNTPIPNLTGDGTNPYIILPQVMWDVGANYNSGSGAFVAPATGYYFFYYNLLLQGINVAHGAQGGFVEWELNGPLGQYNGTSDFNPYVASVNTGATPNYLGVSACMTISMNAGDVVKVFILYGGGGQPKTIGIAAGDLLAIPQVVSSHYGGYRIA